MRAKRKNKMTFSPIALMWVSAMGLLLGLSCQEDTNNIQGQDSTAQKRELKQPPKGVSQKYSAEKYHTQSGETLADKQAVPSSEDSEKTLEHAGLGNCKPAPENLKGAEVDFAQLNHKNDASILGIDVSVYQGLIDWKRVRAAEVDFVFVKASEGDKYADRCFNYNWQQARQQEIPRGAYHVLHPSQDAVAQAAHFMKVVGANIGELPPVLDLESAILETTNINEVIKRVSTWLTYVKEKAGIQPMIYAGHATTKGYFGSEDPFGNIELWFAEYKHGKPTIPKEWGRWTFWQFSPKGSVNGINQLVDMNRFNGDTSTFGTFLAKSEQTNPLIQKLGEVHGL